MPQVLTYGMIGSRRTCAIMDSIQKKNFSAFLIHALFLALTLNFIDVNTVVPNMLAEAGGTAVHMGILSAIMVGGTKLMQLVFAGIIVPMRRKKPALLVGIYIRVAALLVIGLFLRNLGGEAMWKVWTLILVMTVFSFSGAFANISYTDIMGRVIAPQQRKRLLVVKQLISSIGVIVSALLVKVILSLLSYPQNYSLLFLLAGLLLFMGTSGFWMIVEPSVTTSAHPQRKVNLKEFALVLKQDPNLRKYLFLINTSGVIISTLPFFILYARQRFTVDGNLTGTFLLVQMVGALSANLVLNFFSKSQRYRTLIYLFVIISAITPVVAFILPALPLWYSLVFLLSGISYSISQILFAGVLLEISTDENRAVYTGISGAGSIMQVVYPLLTGYLVTRVGFGVVFILTSVYILLGLRVAATIRCGLGGPVEV
ncbi:MAG: hypothetical protein CVV52_03190 [Spirochaetae bacterium HGW-Spirochaetae-8]|nr:MAG: hypothetical protein CVV52_03190 [Spirochaetae bacterium HGW-Spirochaetae-8]